MSSFGLKEKKYGAVSYLFSCTKSQFIPIRSMLNLETFFGIKMSLIWSISLISRGLHNSILQDSVQFRSSYNRFLKQRKIHANSGRSVKVITPALKQMKSWWTTNYGHPERAFSKILNFWAWADKLGRKFWGHLGYFRPNYQSLVHVFHFNQPLFLTKN